MKYLIMLSLFFTFHTFGKTEGWVIDKAHTKVGFDISHLVISSVEGQFKEFSGDLMFDLDNPKKSVNSFKLNAVVNASSIDTGSHNRDKHLRSADFFDVKKYKKLKFVSKSFSTNDGKTFEIRGDLTISGKTKPVIFKTKFLGSMEVYDVKRVAFVATTKIKRQDFGLTWNDGDVSAEGVGGKLIEATGVVGSEVEIKLKIQAKRKSDL